MQNIETRHFKVGPEVGPHLYAWLPTNVPFKHFNIMAGQERFQVCIGTDNHELVSWLVVSLDLADFKGNLLILDGFEHWESEV